ncbi:hypothetical protein GF360_01685 [candidate division WWE3 bacterium]|nr:hypothetical protein [candidate division WWE3 bacterium]
MVDVKNQDPVVDSAGDKQDDSIADSSTPSKGRTSGPQPTAPEGLAFQEKKAAPEKEKGVEKITDLKVPTPKALQEDDDEEVIDFKKEDPGDSVGRVVDMRSKTTKTKPIEDPRHELTEYGDEKEADFIEKVKAAHESSES